MAAGKQPRLKLVQPALSITPGRELEAAPAPLFEGGPTAPTVGRHQPFQWLAWDFHRVRYEQLGDRFFDPWEGKHQAACKKLMARSRGDKEEVLRRMRHLWLWCQISPDYYKFQPQCFLRSWDDLHMPPTDAVGGRSALRGRSREAERDRFRDELRARQ